MNSKDNNNTQKGTSYLTKITASLLRLGRDSKDVGQKYSGKTSNLESNTNSSSVFSSTENSSNGSKTGFSEESTEANTFELLHNLFI